MRLRHFFPFLIFCAFAAPATAQQILLPAQWKFRTGDDPAWKNPDFNDSAWTSVSLPANWEAMGFPDYDGFGWYRTTFTAPENLLGQPFVLLAGQIDDADETFLNGVLIGRTGEFPPGGQSAWDTPRKYAVAAGALKKHNTLAIRVYDGTGGGGIYKGPIELIAQKQYDRALRARQKRPHSFDQLTTSNGLIAAVYNAATHRVEHVYPHIFSAYDSASFVQPFVTGITAEGAGRASKAYFLKNTHVVEVKYPHVTIDYTASFVYADKVFYAVVSGAPDHVERVSFSSETSTGMRVRTFTRQSGDRLEKYFLFGFTDAYHPQLPLDEALERLKKASGSLIDAEVAYMQGVFGRCRFPAGLHRAERDVMEQSVAVLKMAQVGDNEVFPLAKGQILASLRPGVWAISWVRDAAFAIQAFTRLGLYEEARKGLEFMLNASPSGQYRSYVHTDGKDYGIGMDYRISVTRYFGNGREESDFNDFGPNIEIDDFGLFLIAFCDYVETSGDTALFQQWQNVLQTRIADPIVHNITPQGIIRADSGPWEHHLPGRPFTFTSGVCQVGLFRFAGLQQRLGLAAAPYFAAAQRLEKGIWANMGYEGRLLKGNAIDPSPADRYFFDAATFELCADGFIKEKAVFLSHMAAYDSVLRVKTGKKAGYIRINSADSYENQEWPFAGLRVAVAQARFGRRREARLLVDRVTHIAGYNYNLIPEILALDDNAYKGAIPMAGYGAGAYVLAVWALYGP